MIENIQSSALPNQRLDEMDKALFLVGNHPAKLVAALALNDKNNEYCRYTEALNKFGGSSDKSAAWQPAL